MMAALLVHSEAVPERVRDALRAASLAPPERREAEVESAGRILYRETDLDCGEVRELLDLSYEGTCD